MADPDKESEAVRSSFQAINMPNVTASVGQISAQEQGSNGNTRSRAESRSESRALSVDMTAENIAFASASRLQAKTAPTTSGIGSPALSTNGRTSRTPAQDESAQSEPMTRAESTSSQQSSKDALSVAAYGTRSRNRPGASRPNYAEDVEMDFEQANNNNNGAQLQQDFSAMDIDSASPAALESRESPATSIEKSASGATNGWNALNKEAFVPGTSALAATPSAPQPSRKRKAAAVANQNITTSTNPPTAQPSVGRRSGAQPPPHHLARETNMVSFDNCHTTLNKDGNLVSDEGVVYSVNDHVYLVCEPPGEPYYIGRIMEFRCRVPDDTTTPVEYLRINWVYRPRDVQRFVNDTRLVYVTMHSDLCPLTSLRGKCRVRHRSEIDNLDEFRKLQDAFWFNQCFDRFIHRWYEVIPTEQVINVPGNVKKALDERWKYIVLETARVKELTSAVKSCKRCAGYCAADDSVDCAVCQNTYHMNCVRPPLLKKPSRGFAWACAPCSRAQERRLEARRTPNVGDVPTDAEEDEVIEEEEEDPTAMDTTEGSPAAGSEGRTATDAEIAHAKMWPMRYLGIHCRVEDVLQYEDRAIYPRASSRLGPKHQANTLLWPGRPLTLVKPVEIKKKYVKAAGNKKDTKLSKETLQAIEADKEAKAKRPPWIQDEPPGYVHRGEDLSNEDPKFTAKLIFKMPTIDEIPTRGEGGAPLPPEDIIATYMQKAKAMAKDIGVQSYSTDFLDRALYLLQQNAFDSDAALRQLKKTNPVGKWTVSRLEIRKDLRDPVLSLKDDEKKRFEDGVKKYGSELRLVRQHVRTISHADTVRFWYYWKKTPSGKKIWGSYGGRKNTSKKKTENTDAATKLLDDIADAQDDSAFDNGKVLARNRKMICKHCDARRSRFWRRAPGVTPGQTVAADGRSRDKGSALLLALCQRCAKLWRKYAIQWEDQDEMAKKLSQGGGRAWKRRVDEELIREWQIAQEAPPEEPPDMREVLGPIQGAPEPPRKKVKSNINSGADTDGTTEAAKKKALAPPPPPPPPREPTPPIEPAPAQFRSLPCAICYDKDTTSESLVTCRDCRLVVHRNCYGVPDTRSSIKWSCDPCANDRREMATLNTSADPAAYRYKCVLCPIEVTEVSLVEPPKISHKKKTDREKEKERLEKLLADKFADDYTQAQKERGRPVLPREALKRTADNKWIHVTCSMWTPEIKYSNAKTLEVSEGIPLIPKARREQVCKLCKTSEGACVSCQHCHASFHIACAFLHGYTFGFDVTPVKSSRRDGVSIVTLGEAIDKPETGILTAAIWCRDHSLSSIKTIPHLLNEPVDKSGSGVVAMQLFAQNYKQADLTLTGTARKASFLDELTRINASNNLASSTGNRRVSTTNAPTSTRAGRNSTAGIAQQAEISEIETRQSPPQEDRPERRCAVCNTDKTPKWWKHESPVAPARRLSVQPDGHLQNGVKPEIQPLESPMQIDSAPLANGNGNGIHIMPRPAEGGPVVINLDGTTEDERPVAYDCTKCHWRKINAPEELHISAPEPERRPTPPPVRPVSPPRRQPPPQLWNTMPNLPQPQIASWQPYTNGAIPSPQSAVVQLPHHTGYHPAITQQQGPPLYGMPGPHGIPTGSPYARHAVPSAPPPLHALVNMSNGHGHPPMRSPTHPPMHGRSRQAESPFNGPPSHQMGAYPHQHGSPVPQMPAPRPSTPRDVPPPIATTPGIVHGASASPNVRNILN